MHMNIALLGYGNVARSLAKLLLRKADILKSDYDLTFKVTGIATQSRGYAIDPDGLSLEEALRVVDAGDKLDTLHRLDPVSDTFNFIETCPADLIMETTWLNPQTGQPATDYVRAALNAGRHVVSANKGPVAFAYHELSALARQRGLGFFFESTVMDGAPILGLGREGLLATTINRVRGVLNSTTNYILNRLEKNIPFDAAVLEAQKMGVAEADPTNDVEGWDATVKIVVLANVLMGADLRPQDVDRTGIRAVTNVEARAAVNAGEHIKLLCEAVREGDAVRASVRPTRLPESDPLSRLSGTNSAVTFETDTLHHLTIIEADADPTTTAYGMLVDLLNIARGRYK
jgi:homoserine dehydrogenase